MFKKFISVFTVGILITSYLAVPVLAAARPDNTATDQDKSRPAINETEYDTGIQITSTDGSASIQTGGNVTEKYTGKPNDTAAPITPATYGVLDQAKGGNATANVSGNVNVDYRAPYDDVTAVGVYAGSVGEGKATVDVDGSVTVNNVKGDAEGIVATGSNDSPVYDSAPVDIEVKDSVNVTSGNGTAVGIEAQNEFEASIDVKTGGDVNVNAKDEAYGVLVDMSGFDSETIVDIGGSVTAKGNDRSAGLVFNYDVSPTPEPDQEQPSTDADVRVKGDVKSSGTGIVVDDVKNGKVDVVIEGTLSADGPAVVIDKRASDNFTLTAWRVDTNANDLVMEDTGSGLQHTATAQEVEKNIQYIIRIEPSQADSITLGNTTVKTFMDADGNITSYDTAKEGEKVAVKLSIPEGYTLSGVYSDEGQKMPLNQDSDGNYYLVVPSGGGVTVSMTLVKDEPDPVPTTTPTPTPFNMPDNIRPYNNDPDDGSEKAETEKENTSEISQYNDNLSDFFSEEKGGISAEEIYNAFVYAESYAEYCCPEYLTGEKRKAFIEYFVTFFRNLLINYNGETMTELQNKATEAAELYVRTLFP